MDFFLQDFAEKIYLSKLHNYTAIQIGIVTPRFEIQRTCFTNGIMIFQS